MKKPKLYISFFLVFAVFTSFILKSLPDVSKEVIKGLTPPVPPPSGNISNDFLIGSLDDAWDMNFHMISDSLGFNLWHKYCDQDTIAGKHYPTGWIHNWCPNDILFTNDNTYAGEVRSELSTISSNKMKALMHRPKLEYLCYGQRSDYQCEDVQYVDQNYWFYTFQSPGHIGHDIQDSGSMVRFCNASGQWPTQDQPGMVVSRLKTNTEQCHIDKYDASAYRWDSQCDWLIKPRIRIDSNFAKNNQQTPICSIKVLAQDSSIILNVVLKGINFLNFINGQPFYNGQYLEEFYNLSSNEELKITGDWLGKDTTGKWVYASRGNDNPDNSNENHADIQVYWYGNCDIWIDYVRVDNDIADGLLNQSSQNYVRFNQWLQWEAQNVADNGGDAPLEFYIELMEFNQIPCLAYVNRKLDSLSGIKHLKVMAETLWGFEYHMPWSSKGEIVTPDKINKLYFDRTGSREIFVGDPYPINAAPPIGCFNRSDQQWSEIPNTLPKSTGDSILAVSSAPSDYERWLQGLFDTTCYWYEGQGSSPHDYNAPGVYLYLLKRGNAISKLRNIPMITMIQSHQWVNPNEVDREPTDAELDMMTNLALSYGAKGIIYWGWGSSSSFDRCSQFYGIVESNGNPRYTNVYGEPKWDKMKEITHRLKTLGTWLVDFINPTSYIYRLEGERCDMRQNSYINSFATYHYGTPQQCPSDICNNNQSVQPQDVQGLVCDCPDNTYLQAATFWLPVSQRAFPYFMVLNRRCSPAPDGNRDVRIYFNPSNIALQGYNNWLIKDLYTNISQTITLNPNGWVDLGWFNPGEGRLYQMVPSVIGGGTLLADEILNNVNFTCTDTVWNGGHDVKFIGNQNTISFSDSGMIIMNGGTFQTDSASHGPQQTKNKFQPAESGHKWAGLQLTGCYVKLYNSEFSGISSPEGGNYALSCINCPMIDIRYDNLSSSTDTCGGISIAYTGTVPGSSYNYVMYNTFNMNNSYSRAVQVQGFGGNILGTYITGNTINSNGAATGILVSTVTGGVIKNNIISGCTIGINTIFSSCDVFGNTITSSNANSIGIQATDQSIINIKPIDGDWFGGINSITNGGGNSINLSLDNSVFSSEDGYNIFNVDTSGSSSPYHIYGSFWESDYNNYLKIFNNCFKLSNNTISEPTLPLNNVVDQNLNQANLNFIPYNCGSFQPNGSDIVDIYNGLYDTISTSSQGGGKGSMYVISPKQLYDSICISFRHRNYNNVKSKCMQLLNTYPDSSQSIASLRILYLSFILTDTSSASYTTLKTFYETLILNYGNNSALVDICNYLVQKCKVLLHQYSSALTGFQSIINNNQYNYEGLLARWDFMATSLLMNGGGGGEPMYDVGFSILDLQADEATNDDLGPKDKSPFTKDQRKIITGAVNKTFETNKNKDEEKIKSLTKQIKSGDDKSKKELNKMNVLKDIIKSEQPKNIIEHLKIVNNDIKKVFGGKSVNISKDKSNNIPQVFSISQNFPNPFNPTTTIKYALPKDIKVTIKIYDILGKLVITLVNGEMKKAGYYEAQFDGTNFASGVYFYRIEADKFVQSKKMVLVK